jgi:hypothetical protein
MAIGETTKKKAKAVKMHKVMHEFKTGALKSSSGQKVSNRKQAVAIAISEVKQKYGIK